MAPRPELVVADSCAEVWVFQAAGGVLPWQPAQFEAYTWDPLATGAGEPGAGAGAGAGAGDGLADEP